MKKSILIILLTSFLIGEVFAAITTPSTQGSEFYFSFMRGRNDREKTMTLLVSSPEDATIKLTNPQTGNTQTYNVVGGVVSTINLLYIAQSGALENTGAGSFTASNTGAYPHTDCYTVVANTAQNMGYYVEAYKPGDPSTPVKVSLYASMAGKETFDVANVLPKEAIGNDYYVISRSGNNPSNWKSEALIVASEDNTVIEITPTCYIEGQSVADIKGTYEITLNRGQSYLLRADNSSNSAIGRNDLTGTRIRTKDDGSLTGNKCKAFAVFSGTQHGSGENGAGVNGDYEYEQLFPTHLWGRNFMVVSTLKGGSELSDVVRVVASKPCTEIKINGVYVTTLNQSEYYEFKLSNIAEGAFVTGSKPVEVALFPTREAGNNQGAPSMITVAPIEQYLNSITFSAAPGDGVNTHSVLITSLTSICEQTTLNGTVMNAANGYIWTPIAGQDYSTIIASISTGISYTLINNVAPDKGGVTAYIYGDGTKIGYGYSVGSAATIITSSFFLNNDPGINSGSMKTEKFCVDKEVKFTANLTSVDVSHIEWDFDYDGVTFMADTTTLDTIAYHKYDNIGTYTVAMVVHKSPGCFDANMTDTVSGPFTINPIPKTVRTESICKGGTIVSNKANHAVFAGVTPNFEWNTGAIGESIVPIEDFGQSGVYWVRTYIECDQFIDTIYVDVKPKVFSITDEGLICNNHVITSKHTNASEYLGAPTYEWYKATAPTTVAGTSSSLTISSTDGAKEKYWVVATNGCVFIDTFTVEVHPALVTSLSSTSLKGCADGSIGITINANAVGPINNYKLQISSDGLIYNDINSVVMPYNSTIFPTQDVYYRLTADGACSDATKDIAITVNPTFIASLEATSDQFIGPELLPVSGGKVNITALIDNTVEPNMIYNWNPKPISSQTLNLNEFSNVVIEKETSYNLIVADMDNLCKDTTAITIKVGDIELPTIFTPGNEDGLGDTFGAEDIVGAQLSDNFKNGYTLTIFNRLGQMVAKTENEGWDGKYNGSFADPGVYFYVLEYKNPQGLMVVFKKATIELVK